jgi:hypothetical protein
MQNAPHGWEAIVAFGGRNPLEHLIERVGIGENVMSRFPIPMLIGIAEARYPKSRRVSKRSAEVSRSRAGVDRRLKRVDHPDWVITKQLSSEGRVI